MKPNLYYKVAVAISKTSYNTLKQLDILYCNCRKSVLQLSYFAVLFFGNVCYCNCNCNIPYKGDCSIAVTFQKEPKKVVV